MPSIHLFFSSDTACPVERLLQPARFCQEELKSHGIDLKIGADLQPADWIGFHGLPANSAMIFELMKLKNAGSKILWSLDDDWTSIPDWNPAKPTPDGVACFELMKLMADQILCSTSHLARTFIKNSADHDRISISVAPNLLDIPTFPVPEYENQGFADVKLPVRVVWSGGMTHKGDIEFLVPIVDALLKKHGPKRVYFIFQGQSPPPQLLRDYLHCGVLWQPPVQFPQYRKVTNMIEPHIWLAPLAEIEFNKSKSNLRVIEGWAMSAAVVASAWGEYNCIREGVDGLLCRKEEDWFDNINRLILDHELRLQMSADGRARVRAEWDWNKRECRLPWLKAFGSLFNIRIE